MADTNVKLGIVACSGEECAGGTIAGLAARKLVVEVRPDYCVTTCLPLFLAGGAKGCEFANTYPTLAVDGCDKACARQAVEKFSGRVIVGIVVADIIGDHMAADRAFSTRQLVPEQQELVEKVVVDITEKIDTLLAMLDSIKTRHSQVDCCSDSCSCGCGGRTAETLTGSSKITAVCPEAVERHTGDNNTIIYTKTGCPFCAQVLADYQAKGIVFTEINTSLDLSAKKLCKDTFGVTTVPVVVQGGVVVQVGNDSGHG